MRLSSLKFKESIPITSSFILLNFFIFFFCSSTISLGQEMVTTLYKTYENYQEYQITDRRFKHKDIIPLIERLKPPFEVDIVGYSVERRNIYKVSIGEGPIHVLLWSQMHGDESTATMALMDIFNFFSTEDELDSFKKNILKKLTLHFIPMLNPDGAERFQRRNALGIDLNRDAVRLLSPEAVILKKVRNEVNADWGFNLHDQSKYYGAGTTTGNLASISFLAPAFNYEKDIDTGRENAMKLIAGMNEVLQNFIPGQIAKYSDAFEPRAFGDNIQKWGTNTILIEAGGLQGDPEKQELRKLHYVSLLYAFENIANETYKRQSKENYQAIPYNSSNRFMDLIVREAAVFQNGRPFVMDIGFKRREIPFNQNRYFYYDSYVTDIGDLSVYRGYEEFNARGYDIVPGKVFSQDLNGVEELEDLDLYQLIMEGYTDFYLNYLPQSKFISQLPVRVHFPEEVIDNNVDYNSNPSFFFEKNGQKRFLIVNGFIWDLQRERQRIKNIFNRG